MKVFISRLGDTPLVPLLYPNFGAERRASILFLNNAFGGLTEPFVEVTDDPAMADYLLLPHNYPTIRSHRDYRKSYSDLSAQTGKPILVFWHGDSDAPVELPNAVVFRTSQYGSALRPNEIIMPAYAEDLLGTRPLAPRKKSDTAVVGFCGWARYKNLKNRVGSIAKDALTECRALVQRKPLLRACKKGLRYRMKALSILSKSDRIAPNFLVRGSYSGHAETITMDPAQAREEYVQNLLGSDYALVVKGDGNYSYRFFEALSLGRIPVLLNTDGVLPLADVIHYPSFTVFIDFRELAHIDAIIADFHAKLSEHEFTAMQHRAREAYEQYLSIPAFFRYAVEHLL